MVCGMCRKCSKVAAFLEGITLPCIALREQLEAIDDWYWRGHGCLVECIHSTKSLEEVSAILALFKLKYPYTPQINVKEVGEKWKEL